MEKKKVLRGRAVPLVDSNKEQLWHDKAMKNEGKKIKRKRCTVCACVCVCVCACVCACACACVLFLCITPQLIQLQ